MLQVEQRGELRNKLREKKKITVCTAEPKSSATYGQEEGWAQVLLPEWLIRTEPKQLGRRGGCV